MREEPWDFPPRRGRHFERVEILPPQQPKHDVRVSVHHRHSIGITPQLVMLGAVIFTAVILLRSPIALLMLVVIGGKFWLAVLANMVLIPLVAWREHRAGRNF